jgi:hypothetical protein
MRVGATIVLFFGSPLFNPLYPEYPGGVHSYPATDDTTPPIWFDSKQIMLSSD